jgi:hypothetical protein
MSTSTKNLLYAATQGLSRSSFHFGHSSSNADYVHRTLKHASLGLMHTCLEHSDSCPCHSYGSNRHAFSGNSANKHQDDFDIAFEMAASTVRVGRGCTHEVGMFMQMYLCDVGYHVCIDCA